MQQDIEVPERKIANPRKRNSISAEPVVLSSDWNPPKYDHTEEELIRLKNYIAHTVLLSCLGRFSSLLTHEHPLFKPKNYSYIFSLRVGKP